MVNPPSKSTSIPVHSNGAQKLENGAHSQVIVMSEDSIALLPPTSSREKVRVFNHDLRGEH